MDKYLAAQQLDCQILEARQQGKDLEGFPVLHAPGIPTLRGTIRLHETIFDLKLVDYTVEESLINLDRIPKKVYSAVVRVKFKNNIMAGASQSVDRTRAVAFAFRNAVRNILTPEQISLLEEF